jgi:nucleotide-binding universal stress UspA family protein
MNAAEQLREPSLQLKKVLCAIDFSPGSLLAFSFAASIATHYGGLLLLEHITPAEDAGQSLASHAAISKMQLVMEEALTGAQQSMGKISHEMIFDNGDVCSRLLATARERGIDLIVVGTHGKRGMKKLLKGSTAEEIVSLANCPVLTAGPRVDRLADFRRILCAIELSPASEHAIPHALSLAQQYDASLVFLHVNDWSGDERPVDTKSQTSKFVDEQLHRSSYGEALTARSKVIVDFGPRTELILEAAIAHDSDLIVIGLHPNKHVPAARIAAHLPGSMAYDLIAQAPCPVLTIPLPRAA